MIKSQRKQHLICKKGQIMRQGYVRKIQRIRSPSPKHGKNIHIHQTIVPAVCIKDKGKGSRTSHVSLRRPKTSSMSLRRPKLIGPIKKGTLTEFGYFDVAHKNKNERQSALSNAVKYHGWLKVFRKLNAVYILNKNTNPQISNIFLKDRNWVKKEHNKKIV